MVSKIMVVCRNFPYRSGGSELSLLKELECQFENCSFTLIYQEQSSSKLNVKSINIESEICLSNLLAFKFIPFFEFFYNYRKLKKIILDIDGDIDCIVTQGMWSPLGVILAKLRGCKSVYYLRDEISINHFVDYDVGFKGFVKKVISIVEYPFKTFYSSKNEFAIKNADVVYANSKYISKEVSNKFNVKSLVKYPQIDVDALRISYDKNCTDIEKKGIVMIGDTRIKGVDIYLSLAKSFPNEIFYIFGKKNDFKTRIKNIKHMGWSSEPGFPYSLAKVILVPSIWDEAFGRVSIEAQLLNIPVIVSNKGGLPETVNNDFNYIASDEFEFASKLEGVLGG